MKVVAEGYNVFDTDERVSGTVKYLDSPQDVIDLLTTGNLKEHILLVRGGTTTFLAPALSQGATGVLTMSGAPESHLGILSREFQTPCIMTIYLTDSDSRYEVGNPDPAHFQEIIERLEGRHVTLHCDDPDTGRVVLSE